MRIEVNRLLPNPYRRIDRYPIMYNKVESLKNSINETGFWDNLLARPSSNGCFEIAYGHHRLQAIKELGIKEVDIPVRDLDDATMIKVMANENMSDWQADTKVIVETVSVAKEFIEKAIKDAAYTWERLPEIIKRCFSGETAFNAASGQWGGRAGMDSIRRFLGESWSESVISKALAIINSETVDRETVEVFSKPTHADTFRKAVEVHNRNGEILLDHEDQKEIAEEIIKEVTEKARPGREPELTSELIKDKVFEKAQERAREKQVPIQHTPMVRSAYYIQVLSDLDKAAFSIANALRMIRELSGEEREKADEKVRQLINKLQEVVHG